MEMNKIFHKLRQYNKEHYRLFLFCTTLAISLVTSFATLLFSPTIMTVLPEGGDSRKQVYLIFGVDIIACIVFVRYVQALFLKYKSKELGLFLALGITKKSLRKILCNELRNMTLQCIALGLVIGSFLSFLLWNFFCILFGNMDSHGFRFSVKGLIISIIFSLVVLISIVRNGKRFMKKVSLMDLLQATSKGEPVRDSSPFLGTLGVILTIAGLLLGYALPIFLYTNYQIAVPSWWSATYMLTVLGIYMIFIYSVGCHKRGKNAKKYYDNLILYSTMKFQGKQTVKNMCVLTLMVAASLFAVFYPMTILVSKQEVAKSPYDFSMPCKMNSDELKEDEIRDIAKKYNVDVLDYKECEFSELLAGKIERDRNENDEFIEEYIEKDLYCEFIDQTSYNRVTGENISVEKGKYFYIAYSKDCNTFWNKVDDLRSAINPVTDEKLDLTYQGTTINIALNGPGTWVYRYVINDEDYKNISKDLPPERKIRHILFNTNKSKNTYAFSEAIYKEFVKRASDNMTVNSLYDEYKKEKCERNGEEYTGGGQMEMSPDNGELIYDWKYYPYISLYIQNTLLKSVAVYFLLFSYVGFICLVAVGVIAYTRAITVAMNCGEIFEDLKKLGANRAYIGSCVKSQISKIFVLPTIIGSGLALFYKMIMVYGNDRNLSAVEGKEVLIDLGVTVIVVFFMYLMYVLSVKKVRKMIKF